jgi:hypothetical protein
VDSGGSQAVDRLIVILVKRGIYLYVAFFDCCLNPASSKAKHGSQYPKNYENRKKNAPGWEVA